MARPTSPHATAMPAFAPVDSRDDCVGCEVAFEVSSPAVLVADAVGVLDEPEPAEVADVEPEPVEVVDVEPGPVEVVDDELEDVVLAAKIQPFI